MSTVTGKIVSEAGRRANVTRPLTHSLDCGEEGLAMNATRTCSIDGCERRHIARGLCSKHYDEARFSGRLDAHPTTRARNTACAVDGCTKPADGARMCPMHITRLRRTGTTAERQTPWPARSPRAGATDAEDAIRFWSNVDTSAGPAACWPWLGTILSTGYGQFSARGRRHMAHRYAYELLVAPIPDGLQLDHVRARGCTRTDCVNPAHLEPVTPAENLRRSNAISAVNSRKAQCPKGHPYRTAKDGKRFCPICKLEWERRRRGSA